MKKSEFDLRKELEAKPFKRHGFTEALRRRIEDRLDEDNQEEGARRWLPFAIGLCVAVLMIWLVNPPFAHDSAEETGQTAHDTERASLSADDALNLPTVPLRSALLIGFRTDAPAQSSDGEGSSRYRTLLIAQEQERLSVTAEGETLIVPYGQTFWTFAQKEAQGKAEWPPLALRPVVDGPTNTHSGNTLKEPLQLEHSRILYAGNRYVSLQYTQEDEGNDREPGEYQVYSYTDLMLTDASAPVPGVALETLLKMPPAPAADRHWYIGRTAGRWTAVAAEPQQDTVSLTTDMASLTWELPYEVVSHDSLTVSWEQIRARQPGARDALESPTGGLAAILTDSRLYLYEIQEGQLGDAPLLSAAIEEGETLVMAQWAVDQYVPQWIDKVSQALDDL